MSINASSSELREIPVRLIDRNPENPRILFRAGELEQLLESIRLYGVQVPISVYKDGKRYVLIDGERRWRCCLKLNKETIPALVQEKPQPLTNLLLMFNIHSLREQWDLLTIALKLPRVIKLLEQQLGMKPNEREIASKTGLSLGVIRRCKLLIELPNEYKDTILDELQKPKAKQRLTEDFFIEMERALKTVERAMPSVIEDKDAVRKALIAKYRDNTITNIVQFRQIAKIARADNVAADSRSAQSVLKRLFDPNEYSIEQAYTDSVSNAYSERELLSRLDALVHRLELLRSEDIDNAVRKRLRAIVDLARKLLRRGRR